ncbi:P-loop NTPase [Thermogemmatispora carboxidivorans]|uniref:P-loop NTPase n=1 Tax=Thermogemmatispora carboxidivorans TaxID=1382306 RepID=UPI00069BA9C3|nr:P-loop NTPase [Thermogemmatispora carboxidivorans]
MTIAQYAAVLAKRWWLVAICCLAVGAGALIASKLMTPLYQASVLMQVTVRTGNNLADYNNLLASDQLVDTEAMLITSQPVLTEVASHYPGLSASTLASRVSATTETNTQLFKVSVLDESPTRAAALANDIAQTFIKQQDAALQQDNQRSQQQLQQELTSTEQQINSVSNQISKIESTTNDAQQISVLQSRLKALQDRYSQVQDALVQLELTEAENGNILRVVQQATPPTSPAQPRVLLNVGAGLVTGLLIGVLLALLLEQLDTRVRTGELLAQLFGYPVLATVWRVRSSEEKEIFNPKEHAGLIESYRILRTNIGFCSIDTPVNYLLITSSVPGEGKSTVAANLAIFMAKAGKRTLLVDADMRRPTLHRLFGVSAAEAGLSSAIMAMSQSSTTPLPSVSASRKRPTEQGGILDSFLYETTTANLWLMPAGHLPPNPPELLDSQAMRNLLSNLADYYFDIVIFDAPPLLGLADASILASRVDSALLVADITRARKEHIRQARALLRQTGVRIIGCVANKQQQQRGSITPYYYQAAGDEQSEQAGTALASSRWSQDHPQVALAERELSPASPRGVSQPSPTPQPRGLAATASQQRSGPGQPPTEPATPAQVQRVMTSTAGVGSGGDGKSSPVPARPRLTRERLPSPNAPTAGEVAESPAPPRGQRGSDITDLKTLEMPSIEPHRQRGER